MKDTSSNYLFAIDPKAQNVFIDASLTGLFPDCSFQVTMPKAHWHLPEGEHPKITEITRVDTNTILVKAFDAQAQPVKTSLGKDFKEVTINFFSLAATRFAIQSALVEFHGCIHTNPKTHKTLSVSLV